MTRIRSLQIQQRSYSHPTHTSHVHLCMYRKPSPTIMPASSSSTSADRQTCWLARDFYLSCLNSSITPESLYNQIKAGGTEGGEIVPMGLRSEECNKLRRDMYEKCPLSWVNLRNYRLLLFLFYPVGGTF